MANAGWFPDPGGQDNTWRWWDGKAWTPAVSNDPNAAPPPLGPLVGASASGFQPVGGGFSPGSQPLGGPPGGPLPYDLPPERQGADKGLIGIAVAIVVLLALVAFVAVRAFSGGANPFNPGQTRAGGGGDATQNVCPKPKKATEYPHPADGRVHGGYISYPMLPSPWSPPIPDDRLAFGVDVKEQIIVTEPSYSPGKNWVSAILVAELNAGDGFYAAEEGANIVAKCIMGSYYGDTRLDRTDITSKAITVDGHTGWQLEFHLGFDIKGLRTKGETAIIIVVDTGRTASALFYASIPDSHPQHLEQARGLIPQLRIDD